MEHCKGMLARDRLPFTFVYVGSMMMTMYFTFSFGGVSGYVLVMSASAAQLVALLWYLISFLPGGTAGLQYVFAAMAHILRPFLVVCARFQAACIARCVGWWASSFGRGSSSG